MENQLENQLEEIKALKRILESKEIIINLKRDIKFNQDLLIELESELINSEKALIKKNTTVKLKNLKLTYIAD